MGKKNKKRKESSAYTLDLFIFLDVTLRKIIQVRGFTLMSKILEKITDVKLQWLIPGLILSTVLAIGLGVGGIGYVQITKFEHVKIKSMDKRNAA